MPTTLEDPTGAGAVSTAPAPAATPPAGLMLRGARRFLSRHGIAVALLIILTYLVLFPVARLQFVALADGGRAYAAALDLPNILTTLRTTVTLGLGSMVISLVLGTGLAWCSIRLPRRWAWFSAIPVLPVVVPAVATVVGWAFLLAPEVGFLNIALRELPFINIEAPPVGHPRGPLNIYTVPGIVMVTGLQLTPLVYLFVQSGLRQLNFETIEAASVAGANALRSFRDVVVPLLRPSLLYATAFGMLLGLGQLTAPQFLGSRQSIRVLSTEVYRFGGQSPTDFGLAAAVASPLLLAGLSFVALQRLLLKKDFRFVSAGGKGAARMGKPSRFAAPIIGVFGLVVLVLPLLALILVAFSPFWSGNIDLASLTTRNLVRAVQTPMITDAMMTSVLSSLGGITIALPLGYLLAEILYRGRSHAIVRWILDAIVQVPLGVPAIVFGAGFLYVYSGQPFMLYGSRLLITITYVVIVLPFTTRMQLAARMSVGVMYEDAARAAGANPLRAHLTIVIPMIRGALAGAGVLMFVILTHEFAASLFVRSPRTQVLGTVLFDQWTTGSFPMVASVALLMSAITGVGVVLALVFGGRQTLEGL